MNKRSDKMNKRNELVKVSTRIEVKRVADALVKAGWILRFTDDYYFLFHKPGKEKVQILELSSDSKLVNLYRFLVM